MSQVHFKTNLTNQGKTMNTKTREEVLELLVETVKVWPGGIMRDSDPANCDEVLSWGKWMRLRSGEVIFNLNSPFECITEQDWREFGCIDQKTTNAQSITDK